VIRLVTHATRAWIPKLAPYLASLQANWPGKAYLLTVNCDAPAEFMERFPKVAAVRVPKVAGSPENTDSLQHGAFIDYVPGEDADVLIYTDGDIVMQRTPSQDEYNLFARLPADTVACGWNSGPDETLAVEAGRLFPRGDVAAVFGDLSRPSYNIGVIAARRDTWQQVHDEYMDNYEQALAVFGAQQRQQWLVCWSMATLGMTVRVLPYSVHMHGCYPLPAGASVNGTANYNGEPVLFRHHL
jgi:hypothetical protein